MATRYLALVLTVIALELFWIALDGPPTRASAQSHVVPVVITGIRLEPGSAVLPVAVQGTVAITADAPLKVEADRPLRVESVPYTPSRTPGE